MSTIYVIEAGARLEKEYQRLLVTRDDEVIMRVPIGRVTRVVLIGRAGATTAALHALLEAGIPLVLISRSGKLLGQLSPPMPANLPLRQAQYRRDEDAAFCFRLAQCVVAGKLRNQRTLARRLARRHDYLEQQAADELDHSVDRAEKATDVAVLRGIEGQAARVYFGLLRQAFEPQWQFKGRNRRPPRDPINALLSLGYSLLTQNMMSALEIAGLDPYLGYFHAETYGRPALALDLVEEYRAPVVDSLTLSLANHHILKPKDFEPDDETRGVRLTDRGLRRYLEKFSQRLDSPVLVREIGRPLSYRKLFEVQARQLARVVRGETPTYRPFRAR